MFGDLPTLKGDAAARRLLGLLLLLRGVVRREREVEHGRDDLARGEVAAGEELGLEAHALDALAAERLLLEEIIRALRPLAADAPEPLADRHGHRRQDAGHEGPAHDLDVAAALRVLIVAIEVLDLRRARRNSQATCAEPLRGRRRLPAARRRRRLEHLELLHRGRGGSRRAGGGARAMRAIAEVSNVP